MRTRFLIALGACFVLPLATPVIAQQPPAPPAPSAPAAPAPSAAAVSRPDYGPPITIEQAKAVAAAAVAEARKNNYRMAIAIVASTGELVYFEKMDGTQMASIELSLGKARTAVMFRQPSKIFYEQSLGGNMAFMSFPERPVASEGGIPIVISGKLIGAIGVSGGLAYQDGAVATVGASAAK
jgi:glc operon protein GlcG